MIQDKKIPQPDKLGRAQTGGQPQTQGSALPLREGFFYSKGEGDGNYLV